MKFTPKNSIEKFQMGGAVEAAQPAPEQVSAPAPEQDPLMAVAQMATQALQNQDCNTAMQVCQIFLQIIQQMQGSPAPAPAGEPVFKKGGVLVRRK